ncbi:[citrate (pro-3S)-lyase] ligase [Fructobacillus evanidus]|uniref:[Citrate [pro-3S]-lyase] ligase n=1 Tax=Fructobacillus evanidus TaxID=3064281 RepID=A0ABN9YIL1_9LACO|nr:Citrate lyase synthetase CitC (CitC) [Fructobacillus sp. LMG 32999]CAK1222351.1 Citrate lyase synthetase CitC (CitC) [Fructobacillus sp. LMG 32999]CAK1224976.1 Citrate lyase synthetase CitC (CitC) [Fructobacillus sp. LMG 32999]CAK1225174.1 Citrate lyase synthetase CitC (CitC) [Fructobacillus sp. LMG 32999]CAK1225359.1 Citrate lyase synthetase CitC (CitC) [Fructobacillus sp. LMG 32999]
METIQEIYLTNPTTKKDWQQFLTRQGLADFSDQELAGLDQTFAIYDDREQMVGTGSIAGQTLKYLAVSAIGASRGTRFNRLVSTLETTLAQEGIFHLFVFTKVQYEQSFVHVGFATLAKTNAGLILEKGLPNVASFRAALPKKPDSAKRVAAVVLNANPFTKGHRYLVETAARKNDFVYVFVVEEDQSLFTTEERLRLVQEGTSDLANVKVATGGPYMVSSLSFPAYFLKDDSQRVSYQTRLDATLFKEQIAKPLGITSRYVGTEPLSQTTNQYNQALQEVLPPEVQVELVPRMTEPAGSQQVISARTVRKAIQTGRVQDVADMLPAPSASFIEKHLTDLQARIKKGQKIDGN